MSIIEIDEELCNQDGICAMVCPLMVLNISEGNCPEPVPEAEETCIRCGHCVAACPTGALKHRDLDFFKFEPVDGSLKLSTGQCEQFFKYRRSIRTFKDKPVSKDKLERLIDIARYAPSARNAQEVEWLVICDREKIKKYSSMVIDFCHILLTEGVPGIDPNPHLHKVIGHWNEGIDLVLRDTPALIIAHMEEENHLAQNDCMIALSNLELAATGMGLGCCWAGFLMTAAGNYPAITEALSLPEGHKCFGAMMVGYPKFRFHRIPIRKEPKITWR
ncbi:nitroreductase family protein [Thermodesulfobacteriota bacterium]